MKDNILIEKSINFGARIVKLHIALKETAETEYWLHVLEKSDYLDHNMASSLLNDCLDIKRILIASINTAKQGLPK